MSTENFEKNPTGPDRLKRLGKVGPQPKAVPQNIVEQTPPWLKQLLAKYGEREGRLVGLGEGYGIVEEASGAGTGELPEAGLSALLEQMAEEGVDQFPQDRLTTSVEWGSYDSATVEPSAGPIDDLLASLDGEESDYPDISTQHGQTVTADIEAPDWLTSPDEPTSGYPSTAPAADEGPEWLTEMMTSDEPAPPSSLTFPAEEDVPDWLAEALETPAAVTDIPTPSPTPSPTPVGEQNYDVPDWLSETLDNTPTPPAESSQSDFAVSDWLSTGPVPETEEREPAIEVPDWLAEIAPPITDEPATSAPTGAESATPDWQVPDWIATGASEESSTATGEETPDWLAQQGQPDQDLPSLDWLFEEIALQATPEAESSAPAGESPDWSFNEPASSSVASFEPPATPSTSSSPLEVPSWLADMEIASSPPTAEISSAIPDWLENMQEPVEKTVVTSDQPPDWLESFQTHPTEAAKVEEDLPTWLTTPDEMSTEAESTAQPVSGLKRLKPLKRLTPQAKPPAAPPLPDWAASLVPAETETDQTPTTLPTWAASLIPPGATSPGVSAVDLPDWARKLIPPGAAAPPTPPTETRPEVSAHRPLQKLGPISKPAPTPPLETSEAEAPSWSLPPEPTVEEVSEAAAETPEWMAELSASALIEPATTGDSWLESSTEDDQLLAERLDWFTQADSDQASAEAPLPQEDTTVTAPDTLDWLTETATPIEVEPTSPFPAGGLEAEAQSETLDWLDNLSSLTASDETFTSQTEVEAEIPAWLAHLSEATPGETTPAPAAPASPIEAEEEFGVPDWLAELPREAAPAAPVDRVETKTEVETASWLADLPPLEETPPWLSESTETASSTQIGEATDLETLPWLIEEQEEIPSEAQRTETETSELETSSWLTEWPESETAPRPALEAETEPEALPWLSELSAKEEETPSWLTDLEIPTTEAVTKPEAGLEIPAWLTESPEMPAAESVSSTFAEEVETEEEAETPAWLTGLEAATISEEPEEETPSWLAKFPETPPPEAVPAEAITESEEEFEMPSWLTDLSEASPIEPSPAPVSVLEPESETPSWLTELSEAAPFEVVPPASAEAEPETELEIPSWLAELPETPTIIETTPTSESELPPEPEIPSWLAGLRETSATDATPAAFVDEAKPEEEVETPSWLAELPETPTTEAAFSEEIGGPEEELVRPSWLTQPTEAEVEEVAPEAETETGMPAWLTGLAAAATEAEVETPSRLAELSETPAAEIEPGAPVDGAEAEEAELPPWLADLSTDELKMPSSLARPVEAEEVVAEVEPETPSWLAELPEAPTTEPAPAESTGEAEIPPWLAELPEAPATEAAVSEAEEELVMPSWLTQPVEAETEGVVAEVEPETPSWLSELPEAPATEPASAEPASEAETPPWLTELSETSTAEVEPAAPVEVSSIEEVSELEEELVMPSWLSELPEAPAAELAPAEPVSEAETPSLLAELPEAPTTEATVSEAEEELVMPSWLTELPEAPTSEAAVSEAEEELMMPSRLTQPAEAETEKIVAEVEPETPSWLSELPEAPVSELASVEPASEAETPPWLSELPEAPTTEAVVSEAEEELVMPSWLTRPAEAEAEEVAAEAEQETLPGSVEASETTLAEAESEAPMEVAEEEELPPWLADLSADEELKMPSWLTGTPEAASIEASVSEAPVEESQVSAELEAPVEQVEVASAVTMADAVATPPMEAEPTDTEVPSEPEWLGSSPVTDAAATTPAVEQEESLDFVAGEEPESPDWLQAESKTAQPAETPTATSELGEWPDVEPEAPDWLKDIGDSPAPTSGKTEPQTEAPASMSGGVATTATAAALTETPLTPVGRMSDWLRNLKPTEETLEAEDTGGGASESTGVLTGLTPLLPMERMATAVPPLTPQATATTAQADAVQEAARHFFAIATQAPQPAALPESLTQREQLTGRIVRAVLYLLFILLLALPLVPRWQKVVDPATDRKVPWTEPAGALSEVLDKQRRELVSEQLGVIDLQQPSSVALVSFDYTTATQGEMQPLAEDVISRLLGQGMRLIFVSLEPEGATLAQRTLDRLRAERNEAYGVTMVNLGYVPGQVAGVRELLTGRKQLATISDFQEGLTFAAPERTNWSDISNLSQVDIVVTLADNPVAARWWIEQMATAVPADDGERYLLAATSATADPFLRPYLESQQLDGLLSGVNGAAAIEAGRQNFGPARQMLDSQSVAHLLIVILIALGTMAGWMPVVEKKG